MITLGLLLITALYTTGIILTWKGRPNLRVLADVLLVGPLIALFCLVWTVETLSGAFATLLLVSIVSLISFAIVGESPKSNPTGTKVVLSIIGIGVAVVGAAISYAVEKSWSAEEEAQAVPCTVTVLGLGHTKYANEYDADMLVRPEGREPFKTNNHDLHVAPTVATSILRGHDTFPCQMSREDNEKLRIDWTRNVDGPGTPAPKATPDAAALRAKATELLSAYAAGDYGAAWDLWSKSAQRAISRADYTKLYDLCPARDDGVPYTITDTRVETHTGIVRAQRSGTTTTFRFTWENNAWRYVLPTTTARVYRTDVEHLAARRAKQGRCATTRQLPD
ncbi:hypothetical protein [Actinomadura atramentaria]|uniref:hypothetical protein n=1 Tax=Actinomadura atramentaria TaxID=1990 RepID=UPI000379C306|nr:hypothetical protein [Actinomadura atramentaria]